MGLSVIKDKLERKISLISSIQDEADFFLEVCNYLYFLVSDARLSHIISQITHLRERDHETYNKLQQEALNTLKEIRKNLGDLLLQHGIAEDEVKGLFDHFDKLNNGKIQTSSPLWGALEFDLYRQIFPTIDEKYPKVQMSQFVMKDELNNIILVSPYKEILAKCREEFESIELIRKTAIWGVWARLLLVYRAIYTSNEKVQEEFDRSPLTGMGMTLLIGEMRDIIGGRHAPTYGKRVHFKQAECLLDLRRLHDFVLDNLDKTNLGFVLLRKYKQRCEWYDHEDLLKLTASQENQERNNAEANLTRRLACYLHDSGVIPLSQVIFGRVRPDLLGLYSGEELFPIEVKVIRENELERLKVGFNQILEYLRTIDVSEGFYVVFCCGDFTLDILETIPINNQRINIVTINLSQTPPSQRTPRIWRVTLEDLIGK